MMWNMSTIIMMMGIGLIRQELSEFHQSTSIKIGGHQFEADKK